MTNTTRKLLIILGIVLVVGALVLLRSGSDSEDVLLDGEGGETAALEETGRVLSGIQGVQSLTFDTSIFSDRSFESLKDFSVEVQDVATGRTNPFEPVTY
jgi:hypothetical protein